MSKNWPKVSLADVIHLKRRPIKIEPERLYQEIGIYCFGRGIFLKTPRTGLEVGNKDLFVIKDGDFILQVTFAWEGAVAIVSSAEDGMYGSTRFPTFRVDEDRCVPYFLLNYFKTEEGLQQLVRISPGSAGRNRVLSIRRIPEVVVPLPPLAEQQRIAAKIRSLATQLAEAHAFRQRAVEEAEALVPSVHTNLAGQRVKKLSELVELHEQRETVLPSASYPQVGLRSFGGGLFAKTAIDGTATTYQEFNRLYEGALVLSQVKGWEGAVAVCPRELVGWFVSPEYRTFRCKPTEARPDYLAELVRTRWFWTKLVDATRGVGARRERTRPEQFLNIALPMPLLDGQRHGELLFEKVKALRRLQTDTAAELDALMPTVLDRAFKGEL